MQDDVQSYAQDWDFDPIAYFSESRWQKVSLGLDRVRLLLSKLGNPQDAFRVIHVAGTNGKGSICAYLDSIIRSSGLKCGLFTSPFIEEFEERIRVDGANISREDLVGVALPVRDAALEVESELGEHPTEFELVCAAGFLHFAKTGCDVVVCEVGLGGRLDATNVVDPTLCVIARIGLDHTELLGDTLSKVASEKTGIIKPGVPVVSWTQDPDAMDVIEERCQALGCSLLVSDFSLLEDLGVERSRTLRQFVYKGEPYETQLLAKYQPRNAAVAIDAAVVAAKAIDGRIFGESIKQGVLNAGWPGRFEVLSIHPLVIVDGAHNPQGAEALAETLHDMGLGGIRNVTLVCGMLADKDVEGALAPMLRFARRVYTYTPESGRAMESAELADLVDGTIEAKPFCSAAEAVHAAIEAVNKEGPESLVIAFGTLYSIAAVKQAVKEWLE